MWKVAHWLKSSFLSQGVRKAKWLSHGLLGPFLGRTSFCSILTLTWPWYPGYRKSVSRKLGSSLLQTGFFDRLLWFLVSKTFLKKRSLKYKLSHSCCLLSVLCVAKRVFERIYQESLELDIYQQLLVMFWKMLPIKATIKDKGPNLVYLLFVSLFRYSQKYKSLHCYSGTVFSEAEK